MPFKFNPFTDKLDIVESSGVGPSGPIATLTGNTGPPVTPDGAHNVNVLGANTITTSGSGNTLTVGPSIRGYPITPFVVGPVGYGGYQTIQSALNAANAAVIATGNPQSVYCYPGTYTENLTFYNNVTLLGAMGQVDSHVFTIIGSHVLPASGQFCVYGAWFQGTTNCFTGPIGGTAQINFFNVIYQISGVGYTFDIDGYSGQVNLFDTLQFDGGTNGFIHNPTGNAKVFMISGGVGLGPTPATAIISGDVNLINNIYFGIGLTFVANSDTQLNLSNAFNGTITLQDNASIDINDSYHLVGTLPAFVHNSTGLLTLSDVAINSTNATPIQGTGQILMGSITWLANTGISGTIVKNYSTALESGIGYFQNLTFNRGSTLLNGNGELWIGKNGANPQVATLTSPNSTVTIGYSSPNITLDVNGSVVGETITGDSGGALSPTAGNWNVLGRSGSKTSGSGSTLTIKSPPFADQGSSTTVTLNSGSFATAAITLTLPASAGLADGDIFEFICTTAGALAIQAVGAQKIRIGANISSAAGTMTSNAIGDSVVLRFRNSDGFFYATSAIGTWSAA